MNNEHVFDIPDPSFIIKDNILVGKRYSEDAESSNISDLILDSLKESPQFVAHVDVQTGQATTFAEILNCSVRCALWLRRRNVGPGDIVALSVPNRPDSYVPYLATYYVGGIFNPWHFNYPCVNTSIAHHFFELYRPKVMFASRETISSLYTTANLIPNLHCEFVCYDNHPDFLSLDQILAESNTEMVARFQPTRIDDPKSQIAAIMFSSGTTGIEKGAALSYEMVTNNRMKSVIMRCGRKLLAYSSLSWITGAYFITSCIRFKCTRFIHDAFVPEATSQVVQKFKIDWILLTPTMLARICKDKIFQRYDLSSLETVLISGSKPSPEFLAEARHALPNALVSNSFGMTELGGWTTLQTRNIDKCDSVGYILDTVQMKVIDLATGKTLGPNEEGELCFKPKNFMLEYYKNPEETKKMIDDEGWLHTGDAGYYTHRGEVIVTDRLKELIISRGRHISPPKIEACLLRHPDVLDAAVVGVPHEEDIERPLAFVKLCPDAQVTIEELVNMPGTEFGMHYRVTAGAVLVDEIPYTVSGKKFIKKLRQMAKKMKEC